ncbi:hypothetical protein, partial [Streptomyces sp. 900105245]
MANGEGREQHNQGSGTFVGGDVHGGFWQVFLPPYGNGPTGSGPSNEQRPEQDISDEERDDYDDIGVILVWWVVVVCTMGSATVHQALGWPLTAGAPPPGTGARIVGTPIFLYACLAGVAAFFARLAQTLELWSGQCADTASQSRSRWVAGPPAMMSWALAGLTSAAAFISEVLASFYGWRPFGG